MTRPPREIPCDELEPRLDDFLDGELAAAERRRAEDHLGACARCRDELASRRRLLDAARDLPAPPPPTTLWPAVERRIRTAAASRRPAVAAPLRWRPALPAALAAALLVAALGLTLHWRAAEAPPAVAARGATTATVWSPPTAEARAAEAALAQVDRDLEAVLAGRMGRLDETTAAGVRHDLETIDEAARQILDAMKRDPGNHRLNQMLAARYQMKVDVLERLVRL